MDHELPEGWRRIQEESGQVHYLTRNPQVRITKSCQLKDYHKKGRYLEMSVSDLDFGRKRRSKKFSSTETSSSGSSSKKLKFVPENPMKEGFLESYHFDSWWPPRLEDSEPEEDFNVEESVSGDQSEQLVTSTDTESGSRFWQWRDTNTVEKTFVSSDEVTEELDRREELTPKLKSEEDKKKENHLNVERKKLENAVKHLTLNRDDPINHKQSLLDTAKLLNNKRMNLEVDHQDFSLENLKLKISACKSAEELILILTGSSFIQEKLSAIEHSKILEQMLKMNTLPENPLKQFPLNINKNHYSDVINFALEHAPDVIGLILKLSTKNEVPIAENDVIRCAFVFSSIACNVSRQNNALKKTKSASTKIHGLTNDGLDVLANVGLFETSRSFRNDRDFLASISENILKNYAQISVPQVKKGCIWEGGTLLL